MNTLFRRFVRQQSPHTAIGYRAHILAPPDIETLPVEPFVGEFFVRNMVEYLRMRHIIQPLSSGTKAREKVGLLSARQSLAVAPSAGSNIPKQSNTFRRNAMLPPAGTLPFGNSRTRPPKSIGLAIIRSGYGDIHFGRPFS